MTDQEREAQIRQTDDKGWENLLHKEVVSDIKCLLRLLDEARTAHDARVKDLLAANNREVERRRAVEAKLGRLAEPDEDFVECVAGHLHPILVGVSEKSQKMICRNVRNVARALAAVLADA